MQYTVFLKQFEFVEATASKSRWFYVKIMDPCIDKPPEERPGLCFAQNFVSGKRPKWLDRIED